VISYAQNQEDVVLSRLVEHVPVGTYVDVGAGHPIQENVTFALYQRGWRGVNIEPMQREAKMYASERPEDTTLTVAAGAVSGRIVLFEAPLENRGATTSDPELVDRYRQAGQAFSSFSVEVRPLSSTLGDLGLGEVHVLKIDVEGMEGDVIAGADLPRLQPWVLVVEATRPNTTEDSFEAWEGSVLDAGYVLTLFDGLNRFYVRRDLRDVQKLLSVPANVFDRWETARLATCRASMAEAERFAAELEASREKAEAYAQSLERERDTAVAYAESLERERAAAAPHIVVLQARAALVEEYEARLREYGESASTEQ
jgi:FkbM family methyltransferase